jgi:hypothetical protein
MFCQNINVQTDFAFLIGKLRSVIAPIAERGILFLGASSLMKKETDY